MEYNKGDMKTQDVMKGTQAQWDVITIGVKQQNITRTTKVMSELLYWRYNNKILSVNCEGRYNMLFLESIHQVSYTKIKGI